MDGVLGSSIKLEDVEVVYLNENQKIVVEFEDGSFQTFDKRSQATWLSIGNVHFASVEPKLFNFWLLDGKLHITCPWIPKGVANVEVWLHQLGTGKLSI